MKLQKFHALGLAIGIYSFGLAAQAGGMDVGGDDWKGMYSGSAWYLGKQPVTYCIQSSPQFPMSKDAIRTEVQSAVGIWNSYITNKQVFRYAVGDIAKYDMLPAADYRYVANCSGNEDLVIYAGVDDAETEKARATFENPVAFAYRTDYNSKTGRGRGLIWINSTFHNIDWSKDRNLHGMLLHEFGHIYGNQHVENTIMRADMVSWLQFDINQPFKLFMMTNIDQFFELFLCKDCPFSYDGSVSHGLNDKDVRAAFVALTGREPVGKTRAHLEQNSSGKIRFTVSDESRTDEVKVNLTQAEGVAFSSGAQLFHVAREVNEGSMTAESSYFSAGGGSSSFGEIEVKGQKKVIMLDRNTSNFMNSPLQVYILSGTTRQLVFSARLPGQF